MRVDAHTLAVEQLELGQHAFAYYDDDEVRWEVAAAFTGRGCALGHKVILVPDPAVSRQEAWQRITAWSGVAEQALTAGQVTCASMREIIYPDTRFSAARQLVRLREATEGARRCWSTRRTRDDGRPDVGNLFSAEIRIQRYKASSPGPVARNDRRAWCGFAVSLVSSFARWGRCGSLKDRARCTAGACPVTRRLPCSAG